MKKKEETKALTRKKENRHGKFIDIIKKRWLVSITNTLLLIAILVAVFILTNLIIDSLELIPIDCTTNKQYTLTEESIKRTKDISQDINIYFVGVEDTDASYTLAKQYNKNNSKINVETIDATERTDIASKYNIDANGQAVVVESGEKSKVISMGDLYTYNNSSIVDLTEEKITSAILNVISDKIAKVYFLTGYSDFSLDSTGGLYYFSQYLNDEVLEYETLDILVNGSIPEDCSTLVILSPTKDFDELTTNEIIKYINNGGNILWFNSSYAEKVELPNVNKILAIYGIDPFDVGYVYETDTKNTALGYASCIVQSLGATEIDQDLKNALLLNATKINYNKDNLEAQNVTVTDLIKTNTTSYYREDVSKTSMEPEGDIEGGFTLAGIFKKTISEEGEKQEETEEGTKEDTEEDEENSTVSEMIIYGDVNFITDLQISNQVAPMILIYNNKDLALNSIAYLTDKDEDITIRKDYNSGASSFTPTDSQKSIIMKIVFIVPIVIIIFGIVVWQFRRIKT